MCKLLTGLAVSLMDEFTHFDPRRYWAEINNDNVSRIFIGSDQKNLDILIHFLRFERTLTEIISQLDFKKGYIARLFGLLSSARHITLEKKETNGSTSYRVIDFRK